MSISKDYWKVGKSEKIKILKDVVKKYGGKFTYSAPAYNRKTIYYFEGMSDTRAFEKDARKIMSDYYPDIKSKEVGEVEIIV